MGGLGKTCTPSVCEYYIRNTKKDFFPNLPFLLFPTVLKYIPKRRRIPRPIFYELYKSSELSSADGDGERGKSAEN